MREGQPNGAAGSIQAWQERTGTNNRQLLAMMHARGVDISEAHLSNVLKGSRRCSLRKAIVLSEITGVPIRTIARWPSEIRPSLTSGVDA